MSRSLPILLCASLAMVPCLLGSASGEEKRDIVDTAVAAGSFKTLAAALEAADLIGALKGKGPFTVFAPTDEAFKKIPKRKLDDLLKPENKKLLATILKYHVVPGRVMSKQVVELSGAKTLIGQRVDIRVREGGVRIDKAKVVKADIQATNGVIHVIDRVIMPATDDIIATAVKAGSFKTLAAALKAAGLVSTLQGEGPFTVFAPTDEAFGKLPEGTVETLLKPENSEKLKAVLTYHVVAGRVFSDQVISAGSAKTLQGAKVQFKSKGKSVYVNSAKVVKADIDASNGVIHVIDSVILPPERTAKGG